MKLEEWWQNRVPVPAGAWRRVLEGAEMGRHSSAVAMRAHPEQQARWWLPQVVVPCQGGRKVACGESVSPNSHGMGMIPDLGLPSRPARDLADANRRDATIPCHHAAGGGSAGHMCLTTTEGWTYHARNRDPIFCDVLSRVFAHTRSSLGFRDAMPSGLGKGCSRK